MRKTLTVLVTVALLTCLSACKTESYSTSTTDVSLTTTKDGETTENKLSSEVSVGVTSDADDVENAQDIESEGAKYDSEVYDLNFFINDNGNLVVYGPETDTDYWRHLVFDEETDTMVFVADEIDENGVYYVEIAPAIKDGSGQTVLGHFTPESGEEAVDFAIVDVELEDGKVVSVLNSGFTDEL